jgi:hypothetical protein
VSLSLHDTNMEIMETATMARSSFMRGRYTLEARAGIPVNDATCPG